MKGQTFADIKLLIRIAQPKIDPPFLLDEIYLRVPECSMGIVGILPEVLTITEKALLCK